MPSEEKERSRGLMWVVWLVALTPLVYVLSIGPVGVICERMGINPGPAGVVARVVYAPVFWLDDNTPLQQPLRWYVRLWGGE